MTTTFATIDNVKIGDILTYAYQYNSRHPKFIRVTRRTKSMIWVEELGKKVVEDDGYGQNGTCIADESISIRIDNKGYRFTKHGTLKIDGCYCFQWDGTPEMFYTD